MGGGRHTEIKVGLADDFIDRRADNLSGRLVGDHVAPLAVARKDVVGNGVDDRPQQRFCITDALFALNVFGDVAHDALDICRLPFTIAHKLSGHFDWKQRAGLVAHPALQHGDVFACKQASHDVVCRFRLAGEFKGALGVDLLDCVAEHIDGALVRREMSAVQVEQKDGVVNLIEERPDRPDRKRRHTGRLIP